MEGKFTTKQISVDRERITTIMDKVRSGEFSIPQFQRDFIWTPRDIVDFFDSILKGYPIGSLLMWIPESDQFYCIDNLEGFKVDSNSAPDKCYVLDGRQRLTTLASVLYKEGKNAEHYYVDLRDMHVVHVGSRKPSSIYFLQLADAYDTFALVDYLDRLRTERLPESERTVYANRAKEVNKILLSYDIGYIKVKGGFIDDAVEIFSRLNAKTTPISPDYMIQALMYTKNSDYLFADDISAIRQDLAEYNMSNIKRDVLLKCAYNYTKKSFVDARVEDIQSLGDQLPEVMQHVKEDVLKAAKFLYEDCGIVDIKLLPYTNHFIYCSMFFKYNPEPTNEQKQLLKTWLFRTAYENYFTNTSLGLMRNDFNGFKKFCQGDISYLYSAQEIEIGAVPSYSALTSVRNCAFALAVINQCKQENVKVDDFSTFMPALLPERTIEMAVFCYEKSDRQEVKELFDYNIDWDPKFEKKYLLTKEMMQYYWHGDFPRFCETRREFMKRIELDFLMRTLGKYYRMSYTK